MVDPRENDESSAPKEPQASACANSPSPSVATPVQPVDNEDRTSDIERFFCIYCGYDLTGHAGERRRCPECGKTTWVEELKIALSIQKRGIEAFDPAVIPSLLFMPLIVFGLASIATAGPNWWWTISLPCLGVWVWSIKSFYVRYRHHYDWLWFLLESHVLVVLLPTSAPFFLLFTIAVVFTRDPEMLIVSAVSAILLTVSILAYYDMKRRLRAYKLPKPSETNVATQ